MINSSDTALIKLQIDQSKMGFHFLSFLVITVHTISQVTWAFPNRLSCQASLTPGQTIMSTISLPDASHKIQIRRGANLLSSGSRYTPGEILTVQISPTTNIQYLFQATNSYFVTSSQNLCNNQRTYNNNNAQIKMPTNGNVSIWGGWATGYSSVYITPTFYMIPPPLVAPSFVPTVIPSIIATLRPTLAPVLPNSPTPLPTIVPTRTPTSVPSLSPTLQSSPQVSFTSHIFMTGLISTSLSLAAQLALVNTTAKSMNIPVANVHFVSSQSRRLTQTEIRPSVAVWSEQGLVVPPTFSDSEVSLLGYTAVVTLFTQISVSYFPSTSSTSSIYSALTHSLNNSIVSGSFTKALKQASLALGASDTATASPLSLSVSEASLQQPPTASPTVKLTYTPSSLPTIEEPELPPTLPTSQPTITSSLDNIKSPIQSNHSLKSDTTQIQVPSDQGLRFAITIPAIICSIFIFSLIVSHAYRNEETVSEPWPLYKCVLSVLVLVVGVVALTLACAWATNNSREYFSPISSVGFLGRPSWRANVFAYHPVLMVGGFFVPQVFALIVWMLFKNRTLAFRGHILAQLVSVGSLVAGMRAVVAGKYMSGSPHLVTMHSWVGVAAIAVFATNAIFGWYVYSSPVGSAVLSQTWNLDFSSMQYSLSGIVFMLSAVAVLTGIANQQSLSGCAYTSTSTGLTRPLSPAEKANPGSVYPSLPDACKVSNGLGVAVIMCVILLGFLDSQRIAEAHSRTLILPEMLGGGEVDTSQQEEVANGAVYKKIATPASVSVE